MSLNYIRRVTNSLKKKERCKANHVDVILRWLSILKIHWRIQTKIKHSKWPYCKLHVIFSFFNLQRINIIILIIIFAANHWQDIDLVCTLSVNMETNYVNVYMLTFIFVFTYRNDNSNLKFNEFSCKAICVWILLIS